MIRHYWNSLTSAVRRSLPPPLYLIIAGTLLGLIEVMWFSILYFFGPNGSLDTLLEIRDGLIAVALIAYGAFRVVAFHPLFLRDYSTWLERTPWQPGLPLPLGPVHLIWPDLLVAGGLALLLEDPRELFDPDGARLSGLAGLLMFTLSHTMTITMAVWLSQPRRHAYAAAFLLALGVRLSVWSPIVGLSVLAAGVVMANLGLTRSWQQFPWVETSDWLARLKTGWKSSQMRRGQGFADDPAPDRVPPAELGWPFGVCSPFVSPQMISRREKMLLATLVGFWIHNSLAILPHGESEVMSGMLLLYGSMFVVIRKLSVYVGNHAPPINLAGRLLTWRWIVPKYDAVVIGPLSVVVVPGIVGLAGHFWLEIPLTILVPVTLTLMLWTASLAGPTPTEWKLTAPARITPGRLNRNQFEELS
ncbi:MAG: hypothetical protein ACKVII_16890 [Planctomycetales bacterium]|jgi:hypothetical protein